MEHIVEVVINWIVILMAVVGARPWWCRAGQDRGRHPVHPGR